MRITGFSRVTATILAAQFCLNFVCDAYHCSGFRNITMTDVPGEISSHRDVGSVRHRHSQLCTWQINAPHGKRGAVWFVYIDLEELIDYVSLFDGGGSSRLIAKVSRAATRRFVSPKYVSTGRVMTAVFRSDSSGAGFGFRLRYESVDSNSNASCQEKTPPMNHLLTDGLIKSHYQFGRAPYSPNMTCSWIIPAKRHRFIHLSLINMSLGEGDSLTLIGKWVGKWRFRNLTFHGWTALDKFEQLATSSVRIEFKSDGRFESTGFVISYRYDQYCSGQKTLTAADGQIETHSGVGEGNLWKNLFRTDTCSWTVVQTPGNRISFQFVKLSLATSRDQVLLIDGFGNKILHLTRDSKLTEILNKNFTVNSSKVTVNFRAPFFSTKSSFRLVYSTSNDFCHRFQNLTVNSDGIVEEIESHARAGAQRHRHNMRCTWQIWAPSGGRIAAWFIYLDLEDVHDHVTLFDGLKRSRTLARLSGTGSPNYASPKYISSGNSLSVFFSTDGSVAKYGFRMQYQITSSPKNHSCGLLSYKNITSGLITSHVTYDGISPYASNMSCQWNLPETPGQFIELILLNASLGTGDCLRLDNHRQFCGWERPNVEETYWATTSAVRIEFHSDFFGESTGFRIQFQYTERAATLKSARGQIVSHSGFPFANYASGMQRSWTILAPVGRQIFAWFPAGLVSLGSENDAIILNDGWQTEMALLRGGFDIATNKFSGKLFETSSNMLKISFLSGNLTSSISALGFQLEYTWTEKFCHGFQLVTGETGELISHSGENSTRFPSNMKCDWQIVSPPGTLISAHFHYLGLESVNDAVKIYDGFKNQLLLEVHGGSNFSAPPIVSSSNMMLVSFRTGNSLGGSSSSRSLGFRLKYDHELKENYCSGVQLLINQSRGEISSHKLAGIEIFPFEANCAWQILAPKSHRVFLTFIYIDLSQSDKPQNITIHDGGFQSPILAQTEGLRLESLTVFVSSGNSMMVHYSVQRGSNKLGFRLKYNTTESFCQRYQVLRGGSGVIKSHGGVGLKPYLNNMRCEWLILAESGSENLCAEVSYISLEKRDNLTLLDGSNGSIITTLSSVESFVINNKSIIFCSVSGIINVIFATDAVGTSLGFRLKYRTTVQVETTATTYREAIFQSTTRISSLLNHSATAREQRQEHGSQNTTVKAAIGSVSVILIALLATIAGIVLLYKRKFSFRQIFVIQDQAEEGIINNAADVVELSSG